MRHTVLACLATLAACGADATTPNQKTAARFPLEAVPFAAVGHGTIAFERVTWTGNGITAVYFVDADAGTTWLVYGANSMSGPAISPDARRIAYASATPLSISNYTFANLYVANADGSRETQITAFGNEEGPPSWSPEGAKLVFAAARSLVERYEYFSQSSFANVWDTTRLTKSGDHETCKSANAYEAPSLSERGDLVFSCGSELYIASAGSGLVRRFYSSADDGGEPATHLVAAPRWSRDGQRIAFIEATTSGMVWTPVSVAVVMIRADGTGRSVVATVPAAGRVDVDGPGNYSLCWSRDDGRLVFNVAEGDAISHIWSVRPDGTGLTRITSAPTAWDRSVSCSR